MLLGCLYFKYKVNEVVHNFSPLDGCAWWLLGDGRMDGTMDVQMVVHWLFECWFGFFVEGTFNEGQK